MKELNKVAVLAFSLALGAAFVTASNASEGDMANLDYERARWHPIHFKPAIDEARDEQCLACHTQILERKVLEQSPAGVKASESLAWYQTLDTYEGEQETFHRRHIVTSLAKRLMNMRCNTCHQGNDPREEAPIPPISLQETSATSVGSYWPPNRDFTLRKNVNTKTCLMCHGQFNYEVMGLPAPWPQMREALGNNCQNCHAAIRTVRHQVNFLNPEAIEEAGQESGDACYGCHGGRAWYRIEYPYPRHSWPSMADEIPDWAKDRPSESEPRFRSELPPSTASKN